MNKERNWKFIPQNCGYHNSDPLLENIETLNHRESKRCYVEVTLLCSIDLHFVFVIIKQIAMPLSVSRVEISSSTSNDLVEESKA